MKNPYDISSALGGMDAAKIAALSGAGSAIDNFQQQAMRDIQRQQEAFDLLSGVRLATQAEQAINQFHRQELDMANTIERQMKSLMPSYDHFSALTGFADPSITRYAQDLAGQSARFQDLYANAFQGFGQIQQAIDQLDLSNTLVSQLGAGASIEKLVGASAFMGSLFDTESFADSAAKQLKALGWGAHEDVVRSLIGGIDFNTLREMATSAGAVLDDELDDEEDDQQPPSVARIQSAIEQAELSAVRHAVDAMFAGAIRKSAEQGWAKKHLSNLIYFLLVPVLCMLAGAIISPLVARRLAQSDAEAAQAKTPATVGQHKPQSLFADIVVVRAELLPIRRGPSTREGIIAEAQRGQTLVVLKRKGLWARVRYVDTLRDGVSVTGWVKLKQTQRIEDETARMILCSLLAAQSGCE